MIPAGQNGSARIRLIHFTPVIDGNIRIAVDATGLNNTERLRVDSANHGAVSGGTVLLAVRAGERQSILVSFPEPYEGPVEVSATSEAAEDAA